MPNLSNRRLVRVALLALLAVGGVVLVWGLAKYPPSVQSFYPRCQLHSTTGLHCPGCGMTRSLHAALNGQFSQAVAYNLLAPVVIPFLALALVKSLWGWAWKIPAKPHRNGPRWLAYVLAGTLLTFGICRNLPWYPFTLLAPHELTTPTVPLPE